MTAPIVLVPKPSPTDERRANIIEKLEIALGEARDGKLDGLIIIAQRPDKRWYHEAIGFTNMPEATGMLEILKHEWILQYVAQPTESADGA